MVRNYVTDTRSEILINKLLEADVHTRFVHSSKMFDLTHMQWCVNLPRVARQPAPHMGQVDAGGMVSHNI